MCVRDADPRRIPREEAREQVYGILDTLLSHPDEGKWGRVLGGAVQREAIATMDALREQAEQTEYPLREGELSCEELDFRFLMVDLCQPLEHLKCEYERVLCGPHPLPGCSPFAISYSWGLRSTTAAAFLADLAGLYRSFGFTSGSRLPLRPDHASAEMGFMAFLIAQKRLMARMADVDAQGAEQFARCDLAQRSFFGDHLAGWTGGFAAGLRKNAGGGYFEPLGRFLAAWMPLERHYLESTARLEGRQQRGRLAAAV